MRCRLLDVPEWDASVEGSGDERVSERVRPDLLGDPGPSSDAPHDPPAGVPVETVAVGPEEDGTVEPLSDGEVDRPRRARGERDGDELVSLAQDCERPVPSFEPEPVDVCVGRF